MLELRISTPSREVLLDITDQVRGLVSKMRVKDGVVMLFCPHTTAGLTINESADPAVARDILAALRRLVPLQGDYQHAEGNSDAHIKASLMGANACVPVQAGRLILGTWQGVFLAEFDGPRTRTIRVLWLEAAPNNSL